MYLFYYAFIYFFIDYYLFYLLFYVYYYYVIIYSPNMEHWNADRVDEWLVCPGPEGCWQPEYKCQPGIYCSIENTNSEAHSPSQEILQHLKCDEWQVPRPGDREVGQDLWHALYVLVSSEHHRATDHHGSGSATHTPTPTHTGPSTLYIVQCAKARSRINNLTLWPRPQS